jgi:hypothetical protein
MNTRMKRDHWIYRAVVVVLGFTVVASLVGTIMLVMTDHSTPEIVVALGSAAIGGLAGLLAPAPTNK